MKLLFAGDEHPYSAYALKEVIRLAMNTWADVTLMAVAPGETPAPNPDYSLVQALTGYRELFLKMATAEETDLLVLGCSQGQDCTWQGAAQVPQKVVSDADCSVLLVKEEQPITH